MRSSSNPGGSKRPADNGKKEKPKRNNGGGSGRLDIVGLGPGSEECLTPQARDALDNASTIIGYKTYIDQVRVIMPDKNFRSSPMTKEIDRAGTALDLALAGDFVSLVSGGDPGIYAMAGLVFELARSRNISLGHEPDQITINVIPGVSALSAAASLLGSPINHDFATISLSDRLTPWEVIEKRLSLAAQGDFVIVLYNPKSKGRTWQIGKAFEIIGKHRSPETPVGIARRATRPGESIEITTLERGDQCDIDMQSTVIIGSSKSFIYQGRMVTPRGYSDKYEEALPK